MSGPGTNPFAKYAQPAAVAAGGNPFAKYAPATGDAATPVSDAQPTLAQTVVASPIGRAVHDILATPLESLMSVGAKIANEVALPNINSPTLDRFASQALTGVIEKPYQEALAAQRNRPGYAEARAEADQEEAARGHGFTDEITAPVNPALAGAVGLATGGIDAANARADAESDAQDQYASEHPNLATAAHLTTGLLAGPELGIDDMPAITNEDMRAPSIAQLKAKANAAYSAVDNSGMEIKQPAVQDLVDSIKGKLSGLGLTDKTMPALAPKTSTAISALEDAATEPQSLRGLEMQRRIAGLAAGSIDKTDRMAARIVQDSIDDFVGGLKPEDVNGAVDKDSIAALANARDMWSRASKAQLIQDTINKAASSAGGDSVLSPTYETSLRTKFRVLANNPRAMARFAPAEQEAIRNVATGGSVLSARNLLQTVGRFSPQSVIPALAEGGAAMANPALAVVPAAGFGARVGATALTKSAANDALESALLGEGGRAAQGESAAALHLPELTAKSRIPLAELVNLRPQQQDNQ